MIGAPIAERIGAQVMTDEQVMSLWATHMRAAGCVDRTIREREWVVKKLARALGKPVILAERIDLVTWLGRDELKPRTRQNYRSLLHTLYTLLQDEGYRLDNPAAKLPRVKIPRPEPDPFSVQELEQLLAVNLHRKTRAKVLLAAFQGLRAAEIAAVHGGNIDWDEQRIFIREAKGGVEVWRPLHPIVWEIAQDMPRDDWWFPGTGMLAAQGRHINSSSVSNTLGQALKRAGLDHHRPHQLRAFFATELVRSGASIVVVQQAMRHANPATLMHYVRPDTEQIRDAMAKLPTIDYTHRWNRPTPALAEGVQ